MMRLNLDGYSLDLPPEWSGLEDVTYSDPSTLPPVALAAEGGTGRLMVAEMLFDDDDEQPGGEPEELEALARAWGKRRRLEPLEMGTHERPDGVVATATYLVRGCFVQIWFLSNGDRVVQASYVCPWDERDNEEADREAIVRSLRWS
ncbi:MULTISPECIES: hypothetical protein [Polyangium]|uniref:DUF1795 domain-containing protein n=3 Tax=Polyangium TaxID=55 RepID=A0A4U1IXL2_9BACT|nr:MULTISPECIES: hypothetical protein [Polyangium]MDC0749939.1 hypothetical protein [Polyangium mundeleinium]MDI1427959.1 hypothetical protein [Polyangium sorediatum]TKC99299.1 hypothetical protein E8A74_38430 [Polyangium fumosum]